MNLRRYALRIEYDGTPYAGLQIPKNALNIQAIIEKALLTLDKQEIRIQYAGRTDTGVHANGQTISFSIAN